MEFDYVIIGAGSAGCVIANRLSAKAGTTVALLEAGGTDRLPWIHIPVGYFKTMGNPATDWCYKTEPDPGLNGRAIAWPRGKVLGGSSSINGLLYVRGQPEDFDHWRQLGNTGWGWEDVLPYFKKSENWEGAPAVDRGIGGPLNVSENKVDSEIVNAWVDAAENAGFKKINDYNCENQEGVGYFQMTMKNGRRCSTAVAYLKPILNRKNLHIITHAHIEKLIIENKRATAVRCLVEGKSTLVRARCEIIVSAGAIGSPQILMLSGVGDAVELKNLGLDIKHNLPGVGKNLQDHLQARPVFKCNASTINTETSNFAKLSYIALCYAINRSGPMAMAASLGTGFLKTQPQLATPDIQFHIQPFSADSPAEGSHKFSAFTASVLQLRPESRGHIALASPLAHDYPEIHPNYLATKTDCDTLVAGIKIARDICDVAPLKNLVTEEHAPGPPVGRDDYDAILDWARSSATTIYHPVGTCKMGIDKMAVVDKRLCVYGIAGLRVADASIMPVITSGNTNAPTIMIAEKLSDMVIEDAT